jgi:branched-chain amino acid transport system ATP-binding protein
MILETKKISKHFGNLKALTNVDLAVEEGEIFGIAGPNGAGKSTLFNVIAGHYPASEGRIFFDGKDTTNFGSHRMCYRGLARTFQVPITFKTLSVYDNVRVGATFGKGKIKGRPAVIDDTIRYLGLESMRDTVASHLDLYTTKVVMLAACLATDCKMLMLDEPLAGLSPPELQQFLSVIRMINRDRGITILFIEHILDALIDITERSLILHNGETIYVGESERICEDPLVVECYLGEEAQLS